MQSYLTLCNPFRLLPEAGRGKMKGRIPLSGPLLLEHREWCACECLWYRSVLKLLLTKLLITMLCFLTLFLITMCLIFEKILSFIYMTLLLSHRSSKPSSKLPFKTNAWDFPGGPVVKTPHPKCRAWSLVRELDPTMLQLKILYAPNEDWRSHVPQLRPSTVR